MASTKVAVVTGSNQGIGFAIVRALCKQWTGDVYLTSRDVDRGQKAVAELEKEGLKPKFHQLDITKKDSIAALKSTLSSTYGGLDLLINNAGIAYKQASTAPFGEQAEVTNSTNYFAWLDVCDALFPLLKNHARVVNVSSMVSQFTIKKLSPAMKARVLAADTIPKVSSIITEFVEAAKAGNHKDLGFADTSYGMSKLGVTAATIVQQADMDKDTSRQDVVINCCCPGFVSTNMTSYKGHKTIEQGAETPMLCALLPEGEMEIRGKYLSEKKVHPWE